MVRPVVLTRGGVIDLPTALPDWTVYVDWSTSTVDLDVDVVAFLGGEDDRVRSDNDFLFYHQPASTDGSVELDLALATEAAVTVRLEELPADVTRVTIAAALQDDATFGDLGPLELAVRDSTGHLHARATLDAATSERTMLLAALYRRGDQWRLRTIGQGYDHGLTQLATAHGVNVDVEP